MVEPTRRRQAGSRAVALSGRGAIGRVGELAAENSRTLCGYASGASEPITPWAVLVGRVLGSVPVAPVVRLAARACRETGDG